MISDAAVGCVYRCPVCGAELSVIASGSGILEPICCNRKMELQERINPVYLCSSCGSELMLIVDKGGKLEPLCCNQKMNRKAV